MTSNFRFTPVSPTVGWAELPFFLAVARAGSLRAAAEVVGGTHATVDRQVKVLEAKYGVRLFDRTTKGLFLTEAGRALLPSAEAAEEAIKAAERRVVGLDREAAGIVHLTLPPWIAYWVLAPGLPELHAKYPEIDLRLTITDHFHDLANAEADVSIRVANAVDQDVVGRKMFQYNVALVASRKYLAENWANRGANGEGLHWLGWDKAHPNPNWEAFELFTAAPRKHAMVDGLMFYHVLNAGQGMAIMPVFGLHHFPDLVRVPDTPLVPDRSLWLLMHSDLRTTTRVRAVVDFLAQWISGLKDSFLHPPCHSEFLTGPSAPA